MAANLHQYQDRLIGLTVPVLAALTFRAAMRAAPNAITRSNARSGALTPEEVRALCSMFRVLRSTRTILSLGDVAFSEALAQTNDSYAAHSPYWLNCNTWAEAASVSAANAANGATQVAIHRFSGNARTANSPIDIAAFSIHCAIEAGLLGSYGTGKTAMLDEFENDINIACNSYSNTPDHEILCLPIWRHATPLDLADHWTNITRAAPLSEQHFDIWTEWYNNMLHGNSPFDELLERKLLLNKEWLQRPPSEINSHLKAILHGQARRELRRVRAIFIGPGEAGKTSLICALHGEPIPGAHDMTKGIAIHDSGRKPEADSRLTQTNTKPNIHEDAGVFTRIRHIDESDLTVHFWDFGGQVMAHATHQFFMRAKCLYVIVLAARGQAGTIDPDLEAEYWLEHVRAFGDSAPVLVVGNKADQLPVSFSQRALKEKYPNIVGFYSLSAADIKDRFKPEFDTFVRDFDTELRNLGGISERFTDQQFKVLQAVENQAVQDDFLSRKAFDTICDEAGIPTEGPIGRASLLTTLDRLGIVMHFEKLSLLDDFVLNPRWLTYGVYSLMYDADIQRAQGQIGQADVVKALKAASDAWADKERPLRYPASRCGTIIDAMEEFGVAYRLGRDRMVIPALLPTDQPEHEFPVQMALEFRFDFKGFLPRHVLHGLIVERNSDIALDASGRQIVWQHGVLLRPGKGLDGQALIRNDRHERAVDIMVAGSDARTYLTNLHDSVRRKLSTMPELPYNELVRLRPDMRADGTDVDLIRAQPVWANFGTIRGAEKRGRDEFDGPDGHAYDLGKVLLVTPVRTEAAQADVFISYSHRNRSIVEGLANTLRKAGVTVWFDPDLTAGQQFRDILGARLDAAKAVLVVWSDASTKSNWVRAEAARAMDQKKLVCLLSDSFNSDELPLPFGESQVVRADDIAGIRKALRTKGIH